MKKIPSILKAPGRARLGMAEQARRPLKERPHVVSGYTTFSPYDAFKQKRPPTSVDLILAYRNFVFWAANTVAAAVAAVPHRLYAIQRHGRKAGRFRTKALGRAQMENLRSDHTLAKKLATAAKVEEITEHPYLDLISHVNPWMTTFSLFELMSLYLETVGGSFWSFVRGFGGLPVEIWPLPSWLVYVEPDYSTEKVINRYVFTSGGRQTIFEPSEILYTRRTSLFDPYTQGWSPLRACYEQTEFSDKLIEYDESRLSNMSRPDAVMEATDEGPIGWEETQRINNDFRQNFAMSGAGGLWVAPGGTTLKAMEWPGFDPVAGERAKMTLYGIARAFDIPAAMVDSTGTSRANLDATLLEFSRRAVMPRCRRIEEEINSNLMPLYSDDIFIAFDTAVPADKVLERETHAAYISAGVMSRNEARLELGLAPVDGGDELLVSNSLVPLSHAIDPPAPVIPGRVQGAEPDEVPTEATTPESSEREEPSDEADDGEFAEGEDMEASTDEPAEKAFDPDAAGAIPDAAVAKALRVIDLIHERLAAEGEDEDEREDGRRPFRRALGKHNPCHDADGQFCSHGGGGGAHGTAAFRAGGEDVSPGRVEALKSAVAEAGKGRGADWTLEVSGPRDDRERRASAKAEAADRFLVEKTSAPKVSERVEGERRLHVVGGQVEAETFPAPDGKGWVSRDHHPQSPEERRFRTEEQALVRSRKHASVAAKEGTIREHATPKDIDKYVSEQANERLLVGGRFTNRLDDAETHATTFRLIVPEGEGGHRPFPPVAGKSNPCHGAHDGRFCHTPGGGGGAPAHAPAGALGVDVTSGAEHGVTKLRRQVADRAEATIAAALGGHRLKDYEAMDVRIPKADGSGHHVVEVKTMQHGSKTGISVHENAWVRKIDHASKNPGDTFHTVVIDLRHSTEGGAHAGKYSGHELYYKRTSGPFGLASMHKVADMAELGRLIGSPAARLPADARGQFPRGAELRALRERAAKERAYNNERSRERKRRLGAIAYGRTPRDQGSNATASSG